MSPTYSQVAWKKKKRQEWKDIDRSRILLHSSGLFMLEFDKKKKLK